MLRTLCLNGKTLYMEQPATLVITQRGLTFEETKRVVLKELEAIETLEQLENKRKNHMQNHENTRTREHRTQVRQVSRAHESPRYGNGSPPENWRPSNPCTKNDGERCKREGRCFRCGSKEHLYVECPERKSWKGKGRGRRDSRDPPLSDLEKLHSLAPKMWTWG